MACTKLPGPLALLRTATNSLHHTRHLITCQLWRLQACKYITCKRKELTHFSMALRSSWTTVSTREPRERDPKEAPRACFRDLMVVPWLAMKPGGLKYHWAMVPEMVNTRISKTRKMLHSRVTLERVMKGATQASGCHMQQSTSMPSELTQLELDLVKSR